MMAKQARSYVKFRNPFFYRDSPPMVVRSPQSPFSGVTVHVSAESKALLDLLQYFEADLIQEALLTNAHANIDDPKYAFLTNESAYVDYST